VTVPERWYIAGPHLDRAEARWRERDRPSDEQVEAFLAWCAELVETGPRDADSFLVPGEHDVCISWVPAASVFVTYAAVAQDGGIFVRKIEPAG
jgi:hypothetical protein